MSRAKAYDVLTAVAYGDSAAGIRLTFTDKRARDRMRAALYATIARDKRLARQWHEEGKQPSDVSGFEGLLIHTDGDTALIVRQDDGIAAGLVGEEKLSAAP